MADKKIVVRQQQTAADYNMKVYKMPEMTEKSDMIAYLKKINKDANRKLRNIEAYRHDKGFKDIDKFAYAKAMRNIKELGGNRAFTTRGVKLDKLKNESIMKRINYALEFLNSPSSTKEGIRKVYMKRTATINEKMGTNYTWQQMAKLFESGQFDSFVLKFASESTLKSIGIFQRNKAKTIALINEKLDMHLNMQIGKDELNENIYKLMEKGIADKNELVKIAKSFEPKNKKK